MAAMAAKAAYLHVYLLTFNCGREVINASAFAPHFFDALKPTSTADLPDVLVLNLQEVAPIAYSFLGGSFMTRYFDEFRQMVDLACNKYAVDSENSEEPQYLNALTRNVGLTGLMIFIRSNLVGRIDTIMTAGVGVGVHETGHKGAVGARIRWKLEDTHPEDDSSQVDGHLDLTFVAAHLAPMEEALQRRNQDYKDIAKGLVFTTDTETPSSQIKSKNVSTASTSEAEPLLADSSDSDGTESSMVGMYTSPTYLFFAGDLNYRTSDHPPSTADISSFPQLDVDPSNNNHPSRLLKKDQLTAALRNHETLHGLTEAPITFPPTYKINYRLGNQTAAEKPTVEESDTKSWEWASHRWPSWCDRILFFNPALSRHKLITEGYSALPMFTTSDHRPVALSVRVPLLPLPDEVGEQLEKSAPVSLDPTWKVRRDAARRREIAAGIASYLGLTNEGRILLISGVAAVVGSLLLVRAW